jgi:hypothetical protein
MPTVGRAPAVVPIRDLSEEEKQERVDDLAKALALHQDIREKVAKLLPQFEEVLRDYVKLHEHCVRTPSLRMARLGRILQTEALPRMVLGARFMLTRLQRASLQVERNAGDVETVLLDPAIIPPTRNDWRREKQKKK